MAKRSITENQMLAIASVRGIDPERCIVARDALDESGVTGANIVIYDRIAATGYPEPPTPPRCANCRQPYDSPHPDCLAVVHQRQRAEPGWVPTHRTAVEQMSVPPEHPDAAEYREIEAANRKAVRDVLTAGLQPSLQHRFALWPCERCRTRPRLVDASEGGAMCLNYECDVCGVIGECDDTEPLARAAWNEHFGRAPEDLRKSQELEREIARQGLDNPHNLVPCACGEIPRSVAYRTPSAWYWRAECVCTKWCGGSYLEWHNAVRSWNLPEQRHTPGSDVSRRYDIPTHVTLGCDELPKEYQMGTIT